MEVDNVLVLAAIPSPSQGVWQLGPVPIRAYAVSIIVGIAVAVLIGERRWVARGGAAGAVTDIAIWAVPFGIVGGRLYHVATSPQAYFGSRGDPLRVIRVWEGGLGIWGAVALGALGAWIACRRRNIPLPAFADAVAPGIAVAQAIGRFGNYFNQELFGRPTQLPWGLRIDPANRPDGYQQYETFHPTFLYESMWTAGVALLLVLADRRFRLGHGRVFALYVAGYAAGRLWIELLRIDEANTLAGLRLNVWTSIVVLVGALVLAAASAARHPGRERLGNDSPGGARSHPEPKDGAAVDPADAAAALTSGRDDRIQGGEHGR
jgi:prolipoprotein diacylglyceryl transferase